MTFRISEVSIFSTQLLSLEFRKDLEKLYSLRLFIQILMLIVDVLMHIQKMRKHFKKNLPEMFYHRDLKSCFGHRIQ